ncbi:SAM-dependent methyltransferase [Mycobacterium sp. ML4]
MVGTDGDSWDPATGVGMTATYGAVARAVGTNKGLINDPFAEPLVRAAGVDYFIRLIEDEQYAADGGGDPVIKGTLNILAVHGRYLDEFLTRAARTGIRQAVNLGCGLDTRAYRLWWPPGTTLYECDLPPVMEFKAQALRDLGGRLTTHRCAVSVDLRDDWMAALRRVGFDPGQPTVWIAENLLVGYLPPDAQDRLLHELSAASAAGSWFAADHMPWTEAQLQEGRAFIEGWRREGLEVELAKLTYAAEFGSIAENLEAHGWRTTNQTLVELLSAVGLSGRRRLSQHDVAITPSYVTAALAEP